MPAIAQGLDEIVVTATKREESLQHIPLSVVAVPGESLRNGAIGNLHDLAIEIPNVSIGSGLTADNVHIRGVGAGNERSFEQAVGLFVDGVYLPRSRHYRTPLLDVERVEFVRGPQAVLFGLNATAGAISIHTARSRPGDDFFAELTADYEAEYGGAALSVVAGGSAGDRTGLRLAARLLDTGKGYTRNLATGDDENAVSDRSVRASMVVEPADHVSIDVKVEYADFRRDGGADELFTEAGAYSDGSDVLDWVRGQDAGLLPFFPTAERTGFDGELFNVALAADIATKNGGSIAGTIGYSDYDWSLYVDLDSGPDAIADAGVMEPYRQTSTELRYSSPQASATRVLVGAYYSTSNLGQAQPNLVDGSVILGPAGFPVPSFDAGRLWSSVGFEQDETVLSAYGVLDWDVTDDLLIRGGLRYVESRKDHLRTEECLIRRSDGTYDDPDAANNPNDALLLLTGFCPTPVDPPGQSRSSGHLLPEVSMQWQMKPSTMLYARAGRSAKSGGFVAARIVIPGYFEYGDETALGFEAGLKSSFAGGRGQVNVALFRTDYDDLQVNSFDADTAAAIVGNAGEVRTQGFEVDARFGLGDGFVVGALLGVLDARYTRFPSGPCYPGEPVNPDGFSCDKSGAGLPFAPDLSGTVYADADVPIGSRLAWFVRLAADFSSAYLTSATLDPLAEQAGFARLGARFGLRSIDDTWSLAVIGKNLTNENINNYSEAFLGVYRGYLQEPRTIWLQGTWRFAG